MKSPSSLDRSASLVSAFVGSALNLGLACYLWRSPSWEQETEWESARFTLNRDGARLISALFSAYFLAASAICVFGFVGIVKSIPRSIRIYRDYVIGDFAFFTFLAVLASSAAVDPSLRSQVCEYMAGRPDVLRSVVDLGLTLENCEQWFERGLVAFMVILLFRTVLRIHLIFSLSRVYAFLASGDSSCAHDNDSSSVHLERVYLLPRPSIEKISIANELSTDSPIYAPVPLAQVSPQLARELRATATEAWISRTPLPGHALSSCYLGNNYSFHNDILAAPVGPIHLKDTVSQDAQ